jgi:predicted nucleic acid-binding protein
MPAGHKPAGIAVYGLDRRKIALISRGTCTFSAKIRNAQAAGAAAVLVANNVAGDPTAMASDGTANQPTVPAYMVANSDGQALKTNGAYEQGPADFADCVLAMKAQAAGCDEVATFDRGMKALPAVKLL